MTLQSGTCAWADEPHIVWYWDTRDSRVFHIPSSSPFDNHADAIAFVDELGTPDWLGWVKAFRADNEAYECYRWRRPAPAVPPPPPPYRPIEPGSDPESAPTVIGWGCILIVMTTIAFFTGYALGVLL
jgi:hypothetical protein